MAKKRRVRIWRKQLDLAEGCVPEEVLLAAGWDQREIGVLGRLVDQANFQVGDRKVSNRRREPVYARVFRVGHLDRLPELRKAAQGLLQVDRHDELTLADIKRISAQIRADVDEAMGSA